MMAAAIIAFHGASVSLNNCPCVTATVMLRTASSTAANK
jgi:hypothetical protein